MQKVHLLLAVNWILSCASVWPAFGLVLGLWAIGPVPAPAATGLDLDSRSSLLIKQFSEPSGEQDILLSPLGIKVKSQRKAVAALLLPPYKEAVMYNERSKHIYYSNLAQFKSPYAQSMALLHALTFTEIKLGARRPTIYHGLSAVIYGFTHDFDMAQRAKMAHREIALTAPESVQCILSSKLKVRPEIGRFLDRFYGFPETEGLPLDFGYQNFRGVRHHYMYTSQVSPASFKPSDYAIPTGYTRVKDIRELVLDDSATESIEMMIGR
jgi:hypothetical protein